MILKNSAFVLQQCIKCGETQAYVGKATSRKQKGYWDICSTPWTRLQGLF